VIYGRLTAREVAERHGEKLIMLGPVLDRLRSELFQPLIERVYGIMDRRGLIAFPNAPELAGQRLKIEFISMLAQAQREAQLAGVDQLVARAGRLAEITGSPEPLDKLNTDAIVDAYVEYLGVAPKLVLSTDELAAKREARRQQQAQAQALAAAQQGADAFDKGSRAIRNIMPQNQEQADIAAQLQGISQ